MKSPAGSGRSELEVGAQNGAMAHSGAAGAASRGSVLFVLTGSIACYKACEAISQLVQRGWRVRTVATEAALKFVGTSTLEGLTREPVATDLFGAGRALDHIDLARWADVTVVCPATANTLNRMAAGLADDLAGALFLAHDWKTPLLIAPAMNPAMWAHPATRASVAKLREWGATFIAPAAGRTACGEVGEGRLAEPDLIVAAVEGVRPHPAPRLRVLVTSGGTIEPIDAVRVIANTSTGETGALLSEYFVQRGHAVTHLRARSARAAAGARDEVFTTFQDLQSALQRLLPAESFDAIIHAAAVSDFGVAAVEVDGRPVPRDGGKLSSDAAPVLRLRRNPKLLDTLREQCRNPGVRIVGFKLTQGAPPAEAQAAVARMFANGAVDGVVHNDLAERRPAGAFPAAIWTRQADELVATPCADRREIATQLEALLTRWPAAVKSHGVGAATAEPASAPGHGS